MANVFAQAEALAFGKTEQEVRAEETEEWRVPHRIFLGNRPTNTILVGPLTPWDAGRAGRALRAQRLHPGHDLGINSFDQWGVELGKVLATRIVAELEAEDEPDLGHDSSTNALIRRYRNACDEEQGGERWRSSG